jgi:hypothetical protein
MEQLIDRLLALAPLGVLAYVVRKLLVALEHDRTAFRDERRELINRVQFPTLAPVATRPPSTRTASPAPDDSAARRRRQAWATVGTADRLAGAVASPLPGDGDDAPV